MTTSATAMRGGRPDRTAPALPRVRPRPIARAGRGIPGPGLIVVGLLVAALGYPLLEPSGEGGSRMELPVGSLVADVTFAPGGSAVYLDHKSMGPTIVSVDGGAMRLGRSAGGRAITRLAVDPSGGSVVVAVSNGPMEVLDPQTLQPVRTLEGHGRRVMDLGFSADGRRLVSVDHGGTVRIWDVVQGRLDREFRTALPLVCCAFAPDGGGVAVGDRNGMIQFIPFRAGAEPVRRDAHGSKQTVFDLAFSPDGRLLLSLGQDRTLRVWDAGSGWASTQEIRLSGGPSLCLAMTPDGRTAATGHLDGSVRFWDTQTGRMLEERRVDSLQVSSLSFSPDGRRLVVGTGGAVSLLDLDLSGSA